MFRWLLIGGVAFCLTALPGSAQDLRGFEDRPSFDLHGVVLDVSTDEPIADAWVQVSELGVRVPVDSAGLFRIPDMPQGRFTFVTSAFGYFENVEQSVVADGSVLLVGLAAAPFDVEGLTVVVAGRGPYVAGSLRDSLVLLDQRLESRRLRTGLSSRVSAREDLLQSTAQTVYDLLRERHLMHLESCPGEDTLGEPRCMRVRGNLRRVTTYLDDMTTPISAIYLYAPTDLYQVEFYPSLGHVHLITMRYATHMAQTEWRPMRFCTVCWRRD
jgi:hypothetical protein